MTFDELWEKIENHQGEIITTVRGLEFSYEVRGGCIFISRKKKELITDPRHYVLETVHPSPLSASRGWFGCRHFSKANEYLRKNGMEPIDWQIENV